MGFAAAMQSYSFDQAQNTIYRELVGGTKVLNFLTVALAALQLSRLQTLMITIILLMRQGRTGKYVPGHKPRQHCDLSAPQTDIGALSYSDSDGIQMLNIPFVQRLLKRQRRIQLGDNII